MRDELRDRLQPRDWQRPWRDPPGFFLPGCACCAVTACTPDSATVGTLGTESGSECTDCGTQRIIDHFGSLDPAWQAAGLVCKGPGVGPTGAHVTGGVMDMSQGCGIIRSFARPALSGFCVQVRAKVASLGTADTLGITLAYGRYFFARQFFGNYARQSKIDSQGCINPSGTNFAAFGPTPANGDIMSMIFRDAGAGDGVMTICYQINGTTIRVEEGVQTCFDDPMWAGFIEGNAGVGTGGQFDDFEVRTS